MAATGSEELRTVANYQFGAGAGTALFPPGEERTTRRSTSGRPQQVLASEGRIVSYGVDGRFTLGLIGGERLARAFPAPRCRVSVGAESVPFVADGKNAFCKFVREADPKIRPGDEVLVVLVEDTEEWTGENGEKGNEEGPASEAATVEPGTVVAVGRAELGAEAMHDFETGMAVKVRTGIGALE
ncbi:pseudouridine synthase [Halobacteriales archaeon QS_3_64_16]|nr:MAG: pseudouridine synthase [Halobacteriales archaeon QS_3_64_16]